MNFTEFKEDITDLGAEALDRGNGHWQVKVGPATINYYPYSMNKTIFVNPIEGITETIRYQQADEVIVKKLVKELKVKLTQEQSNGTSTTSN